MSKDKERIILNEFISKYNEVSKEKINEKFDLINIIIQIEKDINEYRSLLYKHIKIWLRLYIKTTELKKFSYDDIIYEKVLEKINYLGIEEQQTIIKFFIRLLKKNLLEEEIYLYEEHLKKLELRLLLKNKSYIKYLLKFSIVGTFNLLLTLIVSLVIFTTIWFLSQKIELICISLNTYTSSIYLNYLLNLIGFIFEIDETLKLNNLNEFLFMMIIKLYFYILITYFIVKNIFGKLEQ